MIDQMNNKAQPQIESIQKYEQIIEQLNKKIKLLEMSAEHLGKSDEKDPTNFNMMVFNRFNKNLKSRFQFIDNILNWQNFTEDLTQ